MKWSCLKPYSMICPLGKILKESLVYCRVSAKKQEYLDHFSVVAFFVGHVGGGNGVVCFYIVALLCIIL